MRCKSLSSLALLGLLVACDDPDPITPGDFRSTASKSASVSDGPAAPSPLQTAAMAGSSTTFWPYTGADFQNPVDPINLLFAGTDPRALRTALMRLNGDRSAFGFPNIAPFNCVWKDAAGGVQTGYSEEGGWSGSAIQLECGDYGPIRFHIRLFGAAGWTLGNTHFEVLIPGTTDHEVLSWELAQQLVTVDMLRTGLLSSAQPLMPSSVINPAPTYRTINPLVYNGLPAALIGLIGGPAKPVAAPVPIPSDGRATIFNVTGTVAPEASQRDYAFTINFGQVVPRPFCSSGATDYVRVEGPVTFRSTVITTAAGDYGLDTHIEGRLQVTPVNPLTSPPTPIGETRDANVLEEYSGYITDAGSFASMLQTRTILGVGQEDGGRFKLMLKVGSGNSSDHRIDVICN